MDLHAGRLRSEQDITVDIKRILLILCRMVGRNVQRLKVVIVFLYLRSLHDLITHSDKDTLHFLQGDRVRMAVPHLISLRGKRHIDHLRFHLRLTESALHACPCLVEHPLDLFPRIIDELPYLRPLLGRDVLHSLQHSCELALFAQKVDADVI